MKKLILLTVVLVFAAVKPAHAQFVVVSWCSPNLGDPTFCFDVVGPVFSGTANVSMGAICDNGKQPSVDAGVSAVGCFLPVVLSADTPLSRGERSPATKGSGQDVKSTKLAFYLVCIIVCEIGL